MAARQGRPRAEVRPAATQAVTREAPDWLLCAGLVLAVCAVYFRVTGYDFVDLDDPAYVAANAQVLKGLTWENLRWVFLPSDTNYFHPLTWLSLMLDVSLFGPSAGALHATNLVLHAANSVLLFLLARRMLGSRWTALAVAGAFALHPMHVESVAWITARKDVLFAFFGLVSLHGYLGWTRGGGGRSLGLSLAAYAASLLCKPMLVTLPALLVLLDLWPLRRLRGAGAWPAPRELAALALEKWPYWLLALASGAATLVSHPVSYGVFDASLGLRLANAVVSYALYLQRLFLPLGLALLHPFPTSLPPLQVVGSGLALAAVTGLAAWQWPRRPCLLVGWLWFLVALAPVIVPPKVGMHVGTADRMAYLPYWGPYLALAALGAELAGAWAPLRGRRGLTVLACLLPFAALGAAAWNQVGYWKDKYVAYERALAVTRDNFYVLSNYGVLMLRRGDLAAAERHLRAAYALHPEHPMALANMGHLHTAAGRFEEALEMFRRALPGDLATGGPAHEDHYGMGYSLARLGRYAEAEEHYLKTIALKPDYAMAHNDLGNIALARGSLREAEARYGKALELVPEYSIARENLARVRARLAAGG